MAEEVILRFDEVTFEYVHKRPLLDSASFSVRRGSKITLMGQNGAGKSTLFGLIKKELKPKSGQVSVTNNVSVGTAEQVVARANFNLTIEEYFTKAFEVVPGNIKGEIHKVMEAVNFDIPTDRQVGELSGGQQARLLLAYALIQNPDILLLDEPTNNLDEDGINHLIQFLIMYDKTVIVISHDADFLNCFTDGVLYLDSYTKKIETYVGDYYAVVEEIQNRIEREKKKNAQLEKLIKDRKEKVNFFAHKGGKMRKLAKKMKDETEDLEDSLVDVKRDDKTIKDFTIPAQELDGAVEVVKIKTIKIIENHQPVLKQVDLVLTKRTKMLISGPNGIGKSTLLRHLVSDNNEGAEIPAEVRVGYYSQDFATLDYEATVLQSLEDVVVGEMSTQEIRAIAASFLITGNLMDQKVADLSEGQKGLLSFARLVLMKPALLILDEPTNHINFRHLPVIAKAINEFEGAVILVSHMKEFVDAIKITEELNLTKV